VNLREAPALGGTGASRLSHGIGHVQGEAGGCLSTAVNVLELESFLLGRAFPAFLLEAPAKVDRADSSLTKIDDKEPEDIERIRTKARATALSTGEAIITEK
jgi:hypothetical protein